MEKENILAGSGPDTRLSRLHEAAEAGDAAAQTELGILYHSGQAGRRDDNEAARWFLKAAEQGNAMAQFSVAYLHRHGLGLPQDNAAALEWYQKAADRGHAGAANNVGVMYRDGVVGPQDLMVAEKYFQLAAAMGDKEAQFSLIVLRKSIPLLPLIDQLSEGDFSVLQAASQKAANSVKAMTTKGSANHALWEAMEPLGWTKREELQASFAAAVTDPSTRETIRSQTVLYAITGGNHSELSRAMHVFSARRSAKRS